jgi:hypothetical protein
MSGTLSLGNYFKPLEVPMDAVRERALEQGAVTHTCNSRYLGSGDKRIVVQGQPVKSQQERISKNKPGMVVHAYNPSYMGGGSRRILVHGWPRKKA